MSEERIRASVLALLFDLDGTLFDTFDQILRAQNGALAAFGEPPLTAEELQPLIGMPVIKQMEVTRGMAGPRVVAINEEYYRRFRAEIERGVRTYAGVPETLAVLRDRRIGTVTTRRQSVADRMLRLAAIREFFTAVVGGDEVTRPKPEPDLAVYAAKSLGCSPAECVVVGDAPVDILAGRAAGARTVAAMYGYGSARDLRSARPDEMVDRFPDLPVVLERLERVHDRGVK